MLENSYIYIVIAGMAIVSYAGRELPFLVLGGRKLNQRTVLWLSFIPVSVMSALVFQEILIDKKGVPFINLSADNLFLLAGLGTFVVGIIFKNFFVTVMFGMGFLALLRYLLG